VSRRAWLFMTLFVGVFGIPVVLIQVGVVAAPDSPCPGVALQNVSGEPPRMRSYRLPRGELEYVTWTDAEFSSFEAVGQDKGRSVLIELGAWSSYERPLTWAPSENWNVTEVSGPNGDVLFPETRISKGFRYSDTSSPSRNGIR